MAELPNKPNLTIKEFAEYCRVTERTVRNWIDEKKIWPVKYIGERLIRIPREVAQRFINKKRPPIIF